MKKTLLAIALLSISTLSFAASLSSMSHSEANAAISDKTMTTVSLATLDGKLITDTFTGYFGKDGKMKGKFATKPADDLEADTGTWKVKKDGTVCVTWEHWFKGKEKCVSFYRLENALLIVNEAKGFESLVLKNNIQSGDQM